MAIVVNDAQTGFLNAAVKDGGFLQSEAWRKFQEAVGRRTFQYTSDDFWANVVEHALPIVGKYWYVPRGPVAKSPLSDAQVFSGAHDAKAESLSMFFEELLRNAKEAGAGWVRVEPGDEETLEMIRSTLQLPMKKAPHDMQPRELLVLDITPSEGELLKQMKPKTRYNIRLAAKRGVRVFTTHEQKYREAFVKLVAVTAKRDGIVSHPRRYYETMLTMLPESMWELFVAEYAGEVVAVNLVIFFGVYATYLHGASSNDHRDVMAPYLLQWAAMKEAKQRGCSRYDFGGVKMNAGSDTSWTGITRFKQGFAPKTAPVIFPGAYDIIVSPQRYRVYQLLTVIKKCVNIRRS